MTEFNKLPKAAKKIFRARQRLMICTDILDIAIVEDLPAARLAKGNIKQRINRVRQDIDTVTRHFAGEIMENREGADEAKDFAYAFYVIINTLKDWPDDDLFELGRELEQRTEQKKNGKIQIQNGRGV